MTVPFDRETPAKKYACLSCHTYKWIPYEGSRPPMRIRTGCEECGFITTLGQVPWGLPNTHHP